MNAASGARTEFASALAQIAAERGIEVKTIIEAIAEAIKAAYRKDWMLTHEGEEFNEEGFTVEVNEESGESRVFEIAGDKKKDVTPPGFGRIAAQTAKQVILQKVREAEKEAVISEYQGRIGTLVQGTVIRFDDKNVIVDIGRGQAYMPPEEQMRSEFYRINTRLTLYLKDIRDTLRGKTIIVSRSAKELVARLFEREVPEVASGAVEIVSIAREAGVRTKIAVKSTQDGVDPVGSCVGQKGVRVQEVIKELNNEKIDIIQQADDARTFVQAALAPAEHLKITIDDTNNIAKVVCPEDQLSLAIGRGGQNARLAAKLTHYKITIKAEGAAPEATETTNEFSPEELVVEAEKNTEEVK
ncbi:transcription termination/antitermination protein NusA [Candidatus Cerribacteria bacterium 'Amazon FNV 2010 28 9']|uniref:Transcription termination/antitermination protein NusA n=1 Tax=Candidatus Cerribacteria bacterium 'Amazon FNV 2010 28 9' TaxID=2081795 RepID=A0A317JQY4_9BACT|nr:MAG: transcription termination/antitermination protein NusA [Candidatus Cerribacteria bacterium 'Amazon FNV 2010 28 9']